jgi:hypothetical protein
MNETVQAVKAGIGFLTAWMTASPMHDESESAASSSPWLTRVLECLPPTCWRESASLPPKRSPS